MRRIWLLVGAIVAVGLLLLAGALFNLGRLIEANRSYLLERASTTLGRPVTAAEIKAHVGWGLAIDLRDLTIGDNPAFGQLPFLQAHDVYAEVSLLPLLVRSLRVTRIRIVQPTVRLVRNRAARLNLSTLAARDTASVGASSAPATKSRARAPSGEPELQLSAAAGHAGALTAVMIARLRITEGTILYEDQQRGGAPLELKHFDLRVGDFEPGAVFRIKAALAVMSDQPNLELAGRVGPLMKRGGLLLDRAQLDLTTTVGPLALVQVRALPHLASLIPATLAVSGPLTVAAEITGQFGAARLAAQSDLSANRVVYGRLIDKAAGVPCHLAMQGASEPGPFALDQMRIAVAGLALAATEVTIGSGQLGARLASSNADLASLARFLPALGDYQLSGTATLDAKLAIARGRPPSAIGTLVLSKVNASLPGRKLAPVTGLSGRIQMAGDTAVVGPLEGHVGSSRLTGQANVASFLPLQATYKVGVDTLKVAELFPSRQALDEQMVQVAANGNLRGTAPGLTMTTQLTSPSGTLAKVAYQNLALSGSQTGDQLTIDSLSFGAFDGRVEVAGSALIGVTPSFDLQLGAQNIDLQKALAAQQAKAAETLRGRLTGDLRVTGAGARFSRIRPTLRGTGHAALVQGKLLGVNIFAQAVSKVDNLPGIGALVPASVVHRHPELFKTPDTAIDQATLSFTLQGQRLTSRDIDARTADYTILGDGWFDMDKRLDVAARILLSPAFSRELAVARRGVVYLENPQREVEVPLRIAGEWPHPAVVPDLPTLVARATSNAFQQGLGQLLGGSSKGRNPLDQLKGLFH